MGRGARRTVVLVTLVLVSTVGTAVPAAGYGTAAGTWDSASTADGVRPTIDPGQYDSHDSVAVTQEYRLTPDQPGRVDIRWRFEVPSSVSVVWTRLPDDATNVRTTRFERGADGRYEWTGEGSSGAITFTRPVNETTDRSGPEAAGGRYKFVDTGDWALIQRQPSAPVGYRYRGTNPGVTYRNTTDGEGVVGSGLVYLGPHDTHERTAHGQTFQLVVPEASTLAESRSEILDSVAGASDRLRVGGRDSTVLMIAAPTSVQWGVLGLQTGSGDFYVLADERVDTPDNTWLHEYVHTRQDIEHTEETRWFMEASAEYYAAALTLEQERIGFDQFRHQMDRGTRRQFSDVRLVDPSTWEGSGANYYKGALVTGDLDRRIRLATDSEATLQDVFRRMNRERSSVTHSDFLGYVREAGGGTVTDPARRYTETTDLPEVWSQDSHQEAFGALPPQFRYDLPEPGSDGIRVRSSYRTGALGTTSLVTGETLVLDVNVTNVGGRAGQYDLDLSVDGSSVATRSGQLDASVSTTQVVEHTFTDPGRYRISTGEDGMTVRVEEPATPVVRDLSADSERIRPGDRVTVTATVANPADRPGQRQLAITRDGTELTNGDVRLPPGGTTEVTTTVSLADPGSYRFRADDRSVTVTVSEQVTPTPTQTETEAGDGVETPGSSGPGFGPVAVLLAVVALLVGKRVQ